MKGSVSSTADPCLPPGQFPPTRWSRIVAANGSGPEAASALNELCTIYWHPLHAFVCRQGRPGGDARDITQGFFFHILSNGMLQRANREKGRLRSFLLGAIKNYMAYEHRKATMRKRGSGRPMLSIDAPAMEAEGRMLNDAGTSPDEEFDRQWALSLLNRAIDRLRREYQGRGRVELFEQLAPHLTGQQAPDHRALAQDLRMAVGAVRTALSRMRCRYRECVVAEIAETVASPELIEDELKSLVEALRPRAE